MDRWSPALHLPPRARKERRSPCRGFSLVEVAVVVAVVGVLSALAVHRVRQHVALSRSAEAIQMVGGIARALATTFAVKNHTNKQQPGGFDIGLCRDSTTVPANLNAVQKKKYQPRNTPNSDYETGNALSGWKCVGFSNDQPQHYQYRYKLGGSPVALDKPMPLPPGVAASRQWTAYARGDVDGDGKFSWFILSGYALDQEVTFGTMAIQDQEE